MKQSLQIRLGQQITMTPQLQQAIRLLQLSNLELQTEIQQLLDSNIMLEVDETESDTESSNDDEDINSETDDDFLNLVEDIPKELETDVDWDDIYNNNITLSNNSETGKELIEQGRTQETLRDYLQWQLELTPFSDLDRIIAITIIDAINVDGYLSDSVEDITISLQNRKLSIDFKEVEIVLSRIQHFDPLGVGATDLRECLLLQLAKYQSDTPFLREAKRLISKYLDLLGVHDYTQLTKYMKLNRKDLKKVVELIQTLNPRPGNQIGDSETTYVTPDVFVKKINDIWKVKLNDEIAPNLRLNSYYSKLKLDNREENGMLKSHLQEARWFIKSLKSRQETLLKVAICIVEKQAGFLDYGDEAMKPLILHDVAEKLDMHESTISRVTTQKYLHTPRGVFELKYFFSSHVNMKNGEGCSSTAIRAMIKKMVETENAVKPLSDNKIANILSDKGIKVARRTIAKYRESMVIPPSNERKRLV